MHLCIIQILLLEPASACAGCLQCGLLPAVQVVASLAGWLALCRWRVSEDATPLIAYSMSIRSEHVSGKLIRSSTDVRLDELIREGDTPISILKERPCVFWQ